MSKTIIDDGVSEEQAATLQAGLDKLNEQNPAAYDCPPFLANFRHPCTKHRQAKMTGKGVSTAIDVKEQYVTRWVTDEDGNVRGENNTDDEIAILYREGSCKSCKEVARSKNGRVVLTADRPPVYGRVGRD